MNRLAIHFQPAEPKQARRRPDGAFIEEAHHSHLDAILLLAGALIAGPSFGFGQTLAVENGLQIMLAGVEASEDAPLVSQSYHFAPGDSVYFQFQVNGYAVKANGDAQVRRMALRFEATPEDAKGIPLAPPLEGTIEEELHEEDKNWTPKRRGSFLLPSFAAAGRYRIHLVLNDLIAQKAVEQDLPFQLGGTVVAPVADVAVQDFQFLRKEDDSEPLDVPAFSAGDTVFIRFLITGFQLKEGNAYHLSYGLTVNRPDGKPFLNIPVAAQLAEKSFYPASFIPGNLGILTNRGSPHGVYAAVLTVRDLNSGHSYRLNRTFTIE